MDTMGVVKRVKLPVGANISTQQLNDRAQKQEARRCGSSKHQMSQKEINHTNYDEYHQA
ncbi:hypothetical protein KIN20_004133 [Parelaphostrongylus tenuis]|uniref:Uncharacterized protein n=1 Tax=Parelaphostrongylus tenuis TaxID=148309 RepID=A0AAD5LYB9_PARTN|nr:hypothetical protein KIN20_004133 [Parelaphostrongylus tenuis]